MRKFINKKFNRHAIEGFTLVEIMVSLVIFLMAMGVIGQLFLYSVRIHRILLAHSQMIGEISYNMEHISRGLRMAKKSRATDPVCLSSLGINFEKTGPGIKFQNLNSAGTIDCVEYYLDHPQNPDYPEGTMALMEHRENNLSSFDLPLTSPEINILAFYVADGASLGGWSQQDDLQPRVTIYIKAQDKEGKISENQITVSQRDIDVAE